MRSQVQSCNIMKRRAKTEPWGTPLVVEVDGDASSPYPTEKERSARYDNEKFETLFLRWRPEE